MQRQIFENNLKIRPATSLDIDMVLEIDSANASNPWKETTFINELTNNLSHFFIAENQNKVCGFIIFWVIGDEAELHNISISPDMKKKGIASELMKRMDSEIKNRCKKIFLEVRTSNAAAISLYKKLGFIQNGCRKNYYSNPLEDALLLSREL